MADGIRQTTTGVVRTTSGVAQTVVATGPTIVEDWERSNPLDDYTVVNGDLAGYSVQSTTVFNGSNALVWDSSDLGGGNTEDERQLQSVGSANIDYPGAGDTFTFRVYLTDDANVFRFYKFFYGSQSETYDPNGYIVRLEVDHGNFHIEENDSTLVEDTNVSYNFAEWLEVTVDWVDGGAHTATLNAADGTQFSQVSGTPTNNYTSGGIGYELMHSGTGTTQVYHDYWTK